MVKKCEGTAASVGQRSDAIGFGGGRMGKKCVCVHVCWGGVGVGAMYFQDL